MDKNGGKDLKVPSRQNLFHKSISLPFSMIISILVAMVAFPFYALPAFAISPPFPAVYWLHQEVSARNTNCWQLKDADVDQAANTTTTVEPKNSHEEFQWWPGVSGRRTSGTTTGYGWIFDSPLNGKYDANQVWTFYVRIKQLGGGTTAPGTIRAYVYRFDGSSGYTLLFTAESGSLTPPGTPNAVTYSFTYTSAADLDMQGQYLYVHYTWQTISGSPGTKFELAFVVEGTELAPADRTRIVPGSSSIPTLGYPLLFLAIAFFVGMLLKRGALSVKVGAA